MILGFFKKIISLLWLFLDRNGLIHTPIIAMTGPNFQK
jgi:hypothetical protein